MPHDASHKASPKFALGQQVATPGALRAIHQAGQSVLSFLARHAAGDWGDLDDEDKRRNDEALKNGSRLLSAYVLRSGVQIWVITEAVGDDGQRASTTILLPEHNSR
jgi:hypothetical protein